MGEALGLIVAGIPNGMLGIVQAELMHSDHTQLARDTIGGRGGGMGFERDLDFCLIGRARRIRGRLHLEVEDAMDAIVLLG